MKGYYFLLCGLCLFGCSQPDQQKQLESERVTREYQKQLEAENSPILSEDSDTIENSQPNNLDKNGDVLETETELAPINISLPPPPAEPSETPTQIAQLTDVERIAKLLTAKSAEQRLAAVNRLYNLAAKQTLPDSALQRLINVFESDSELDIKNRAILALGQVCHPAVMMSLLSNLKRPLNDINLEAIKVLGEVGGYRASQILNDFAAKLAENNSNNAQAILSAAVAARQQILARGGMSPKCQW
ncbi:HEAT repeat domain-containing protein [Agitococcus lubricus]|uniref:HEAT repeat protein n=1 Tax=Agitococcus lubricus TaxID=1077255 RepID=A0A2T5IZ15_9GAMM|nr:HEAT repeat domain-containing protein [Agitococcus lubricus]PTQ89171.1 hypothetical protein C8N29_10852 [Agitococcus lubricus]